MNLLHYRQWVLLACAAGFIANCGGSAQPSGTDHPETRFVREEGLIRVPETSALRESLKVAPAEEQSVEAPITVPGVVEADPAKLIKVTPPVSGRIIQLKKRLGDEVARGDALFTLDSAELAQAYSEAAKAQAALVMAKKNLERQKELHSAGISARKELEQAESDYTQAESEAERSRARLSLLGASLDRDNKRYYTFISPVSGRVTELTGAEGSFWNDTSAPIMTVADLSSVWLSANVQEKDISVLFVGQTAKISFNAYSGEYFEGKVRYVGALLDPETRTVKVRIAMDNPSGRFRPGMFANVTFAGKKHVAVVVPSTALVQSGFSTRVFVERSPWQFEPRIVKTGAQLGGDHIEVVSGLSAGERIVVKEGVLIND